MKHDQKDISQLETYSSLVTQHLGGGVTFQTQPLQRLQQSRSTLQQSLYPAKGSTLVTLDSSTEAVVGKARRRLFIPPANQQVLFYWHQMLPNFIKLPLNKSFPAVLTPLASISY